MMVRRVFFQILLGIVVAVVLGMMASSQHIALQSRQGLMHERTNSAVIVASSTDPPVASPME